MTIKELDFKKLKLTNKRKEYIVRSWKEVKFKGMSEKKAKEGFIRQCNEKGYVPVNVEVDSVRERFTDYSIKPLNYGVVGAACIYFGKRNAPKIRTLEKDDSITYLIPKNWAKK